MTLNDRFWARIDLNGPPPPAPHTPVEGGCWLWAGATDDAGYGRVNLRLDGEWRTQLTHRVAWEELRGPIPEGLVPDHHCRVPACCNPGHMELVTRAENTRRQVKGPRPTHCPNGHAYEGDNVLINAKGRIECRTCNRERSRKKYGTPKYREYRRRRWAEKQQ